MESPLANLEPKLLWQNFDALRRIPRPSAKEEAVLANLRKWADSHGFLAIRDAAGNLVVKVPGTKGKESAPPVVLQGHVDMVCQQEDGLGFDFLTRPIEVRVVDGWVRATGTTLGADNGIGVAAALAAAEDPTVVRPPLELLFTVDEETGLTGASTLDASAITGRRLLNLDSEELGILYVGCAGGGQERISLGLDRMEPHTPPGGVAALKLTVAGLKGGHSGLEIGAHRANAIVLLARLLWALREEVAFSLDALAGGSAHNAIPRTAAGTVVVGAADKARVQALAADYETLLRNEWGAHEPELRVSVEDVAAPADVVRTQTRDRLLRLLVALPHGVQEMSADMPGLVETSCNVATLTAEGGRAELVVSCRSSVAPALAALRTKVATVAELAGADVDAKPGYPGWRPNMKSPLLQVAKDVWKKREGHYPRVTAIHAGLECGILGEKVPGLDMISFGPTIVGAHTPQEGVEIAAVQVFWDYLKDVLAALA